MKIEGVSHGDTIIEEGNTNICKHCECMHWSGRPSNKCVILSNVTEEPVNRGGLEGFRLCAFYEVVE